MADELVFGSPAAENTEWILRIKSLVKYRELKYIES